MASGQDAEVIDPFIRTSTTRRARMRIPFHAGLAAHAREPMGPSRLMPPVHTYFETFHFHTTRPSAPRSAYRFIVDSQP